MQKGDRSQFLERERPAGSLRRALIRRGPIAMSLPLPPFRVAASSGIGPWFT